MSGKEWLDFLRGTIRNRRRGGSRARRCAVLIDGDNVPPQLTGALLRYASSLGRIDALEMFANFASTSNSTWAAQMREHGITGFQHYSATPGKNATDTALVVRAMDLLHTGRFDTYVLVSSDSDFSALAHRLRRSGASVHGIGSKSATATLRQSCTTFLTYNQLHELGHPVNAKVVPALWKGQPDDAEDHLLAALVRLGGARRWVSVTELGQDLKTALPAFDCRAYSRRSLTDLCQAIDSIEVDRSTTPPSARIALSARATSSVETAKS